MIAAERAQGERTLLGLQVTSRSPMGAIALESAAIFVDRGWLRILGAGGAHSRDGLLAWGGFGDDPVPNLIRGALLVAHDAVGGFFAVNGGAFPGTGHRVFYLAPSSLTWEDGWASYSQFVVWALGGNLATFYQAERWDGWETEVAALSGDQGFSIYPPLWAKGPPTGERSRRPVPMRELRSLSQDMYKFVHSSL